MIAAADLTPLDIDAEDRIEALRRGAAVLRECFPKLQVRIQVRVTCGDGRGRPLPPVPALALWQWPGVVRVILEANGLLVASSLPGHPESIDKTAAYGDAQGYLEWPEDVALERLAAVMRGYAVESAGSASAG